MTQISTSLCVRDHAWMAVCPLGINPGNPADRWAAYKDEMPFDTAAWYIRTGCQEQLS